MISGRHDANTPDCGSLPFSLDFLISYAELCRFIGVLYGYAEAIDKHRELSREPRSLPTEGARWA